MKSINELQDEVIAEFSDFDDWMDRYQMLIDNDVLHDEAASRRKGKKNTSLKSHRWLPKSSVATVRRCGWQARVYC